MDKIKEKTAQNNDAEKEYVKSKIILTLRN